MARRRKTVIGTLFVRNPIFAVVLIGGTGFLAYLGLRKLFRPGGPRAPQITGGRGAGVPAGWSPYPLASKLKTEMTGLSLFYPGSWRTLAELPTDDMVIAVYKAFNEQYFNLGDGTLTEWIMAEWQWAGTTKQQVLTRLRSLQLP
ncbi:MAG: hypothetical protein IH845_04840 [Nanoarchaeota archaeon]|nr:hypothetical protein [Nanoarchaeota archaeon]